MQDNLGYYTILFEVITSKILLNQIDFQKEMLNILFIYFLNYLSWNKLMEKLQK